MKNLANLSRLRFMEDAEIDARALLVLHEHLRESGLTELKAPIPLDDVIEHHLGLGFDFDDLGELGTDVLGATFVDKDGKGHVIVDETLEHDPKGRLEFTQAHEAGHWVLHRRYILRAMTHRDLFAAADGAYVVACRDIGVPRKRKPRSEIQADRFAGALLMPRPLVQPVWERAFGREALALGTKEEPVDKWTMMDNPAAREVARKVIDEGGFENVSVAAMVVRLGQLGYLLGQPEPNRLPF